MYKKMTPNILLWAAILFLAGCETIAIKDAGLIRTKNQLNPQLTLPVATSVAYYVDKYRPDQEGYNLFGQLEKAAGLVTGGIFSNAEKLAADSQFDYLIRLKALSKGKYQFGGDRWTSDVEMEVLTPNGTSIFTSTMSGKGSTSGGLTFDAAHNSFATLIKEMLILFLNNDLPRFTVGSQTAAEMGPAMTIKELLGEMKPEATGTGFFINKNGASVTAAHVVEECIYAEISHKGQVYDAEVVASSRLLDLAVVEADYRNPAQVMINRRAEPALGKQVFVTGYPLSDILATYPSLTMGNVSSVGGLKGAKGIFQFSAPVQPGNSGGVIVDYKGNAIGVVSGSLNRNIGPSPQNLNFGTNINLLRRFLDKRGIRYGTGASNLSFEDASAKAVEYTNQIFCYR